MAGKHSAHRTRATAAVSADLVGPEDWSDRGGPGRDRLHGGAGPDRLRGGRGDDDLRGHRGDDSLVGGRGDDTLRGGLGDDTLRGGPGEDMAVFLGARAEYEVTALAGGGLRVRHLLGGGEGTDLLFGVESLAFADGVVAADGIRLAAPVVSGIATDTGAPGDGVTADRTPTIEGSGPAGARIIVFLDGERIGATTADEAGRWSLAHSRKALADGEHAFTAVARGRGGEESAASAPLLVTVDGTAPDAPEVGLAPSSDTGAQGDLRTGLGHVTLRGRAEAGATVHLDAQGMSAVCGADGLFSLGGVLLEEGANLLALRVVDAAGNATASGLSIECVPGGEGEADPVLAWTATALDAIRMASAAPPVATRALALESMAVLDVVNALDGAPGQWVDLDAPEGLSVAAAVAGAAHRVLAALFPGQQAALDAALALRLAGEPGGEARDQALAFGESVADAVLALRAGDGWNATVAYAGGTDPGEWRPTGPAFAPALLPQWGSLAPFVMDSPDAFRPDGPPELASAEYAAALEEVRLLGSATSAVRTAEQTEIARFWADGAGTYTPPGHWVNIAAQLAEAEGYGGAAAARLFAVLNLALADSSIAAWDAKYAEGFWRPITAIREADADGNDATAADATWTPLLTTPNHPEYVSGHSTYSAAGAEVLTAFFGDVAFETTSFGLPGVTRSFDGFRDAAAEAGRSRIYGGIHYEFSNQDGQATGRAVAEHVLQSFGIGGDGADPWG